jgi:peptidoglycan/xylan/chitin deacetylase (PgdA/CDA1 family)
MTLVFYQPEWILMRLERRSPNVVYSIDTQEKILALTIDDGPSASTSEILDVLQEYEVHATFFLISSHIPGNETLVQRIVAEGHELGNHHTLDKPSIRYSAAEFENELIKAHEILSQFSTVRWFRPGSGWYNTTMLSPLEEHNYRAALASVYPFDVIIPSTQFASRFILWRTRPGAIILLHDNDNRGVRAAETLRIVLPELISRGYQFGTLSEVVELEEQKA